ncbi:lipoyl domain-containing protein [Actinoallomurus sp. NPDC050550]|uniref:lipoyl domain-containing protein n=1 Tax=Actinoallomurus sp. NPDC050550 TaxID=3154937 RepID=UPI0033D974EA
MRREIKLEDTIWEASEVFVSVWLRKQGDRVEKGEPLVEVITDKASFEIESPVSGTLTEILVAEEERAQADQALAIVDADEEGNGR